MECGAQEYLCQAGTWLAHNENLATYVTEFLGHFSAGSSGVFKIIGEILEKHGQAIVGLLGLSFGIVKWWRYREHILHKRLEEYLKQSDERLKDGERYVLQALQRPGPSSPIALPLFADSHLRMVLRERNWDRTTLAMNVESSCDSQLTQAIDTIQRQIETAENKIKSLKQQFATAHILKGAIAASVAERSPSKAADRNSIALSSFRTALQTKGHQVDLIAKELEAHQLRKMGHLVEALATYEELEELANGIVDAREQAILKARAKRYRAESIQALNSYVDDSGSLQFRATNAYGLVSITWDDSALTLRDPFKPFRGWDLLEHGEIAFVGAFLSHVCGHKNVAATHLKEAATAYKNVLTSMPHRRFWKPSAERRIEREARKGLERIVRASDGYYDTSWLVLPAPTTKDSTPHNS